MSRLVGSPARWRPASLRRDRGGDGRRRGLCAGRTGDLRVSGGCRSVRADRRTRRAASWRSRRSPSRPRESGRPARPSGSSATRTTAGSRSTRWPGSSSRCGRSLARARARHGAAATARGLPRVPRVRHREAGPGALGGAPLRGRARRGVRRPGRGRLAPASWWRAPRSRESRVKAEVLTIGDELLRGEIVDSNKSFLSERLLSLDIETHYHASVRDVPDGHDRRVPARRRARRHRAGVGRARTRRATTSPPRCSRGPSGASSASTSARSRRSAPSSRASGREMTREQREAGLLPRRRRGARRTRSAPRRASCST